MERPTESFLREVEKIADTSYRLRAMMNEQGGYQGLPVRMKGMLVKIIAGLENNNKKKQL